MCEGASARRHPMRIGATGAPAQRCTGVKAHRCSARSAQLRLSSGHRGPGGLSSAGSVLSRFRSSSRCVRIWHKGTQRYAARSSLKQGGSLQGPPRYVLVDPKRGSKFPQGSTYTLSSQPAASSTIKDNRWWQHRRGNSGVHQGRARAVSAS